MTNVHLALAFAAAIAASAVPQSGGGADLAAKLREYVADFNRADVETVTNAICNADAADFLLSNAPLFECPDKEIERAYYFRWWTFRKHLRRGTGHWTVSEFLPEVR